MSKRNILTSCLVIAASLGMLSPQVFAGTKPSWLGVNAAQKAAKQQNRYIVADVSTSWCGWCKRMDRDTFHNPTVETYLAQNMVCMKVDAEDGGPGQMLSKQYQVGAYPTVLVFSPTGRLIGKHQGYLGPNDFMNALRSDLAKVH